MINNSNSASLNEVNKFNILYVSGVSKEGHVEFTDNMVLKLVYDVLNFLGLRTTEKVSQKLWNDARVVQHLKKLEGEWGNIKGPNKLEILNKTKEFISTASKIAALSGDKVSADNLKKFDRALSSEMSRIIENEISEINERSDNSDYSHSVNAKDLDSLPAQIDTLLSEVKTSKHLTNSEKSKLSIILNYLNEKPSDYLTPISLKKIKSHIEKTSKWNIENNKEVKENLELESAFSEASQKKNLEYLKSESAAPMASLARNKSSYSSPAVDEKVASMIKNDPSVESRLKALLNKFHRSEVKDLLDAYNEKKTGFGELDLSEKRLQEMRKEFTSSYEYVNEENSMRKALEKSPIVSFLRNSFANQTLHTGDNIYTLKLENEGFLIGPEKNQEFFSDFKMDHEGRITEIRATLKSDFYYSADSQADKLDNKKSLIALEKAMTLNQTLILVPEGEEGFRVKEGNGYSFTITRSNSPVSVKAPLSPPVTTKKAIRKAIGEGPQAVTALVKRHIKGLESLAEGQSKA